MEKERGNDKRAGAAGARIEEADRTHLPPHRRSMVNWAGVVGVAQLVERRSVAPNVAGSSPVSHPKLLFDSNSRFHTFSLSSKISWTPHRMSAHEIAELPCAAV